MFLKHKDTVAPCKVVCMTKENITITHELCKDRPSMMVFPRIVAFPHQTELRALRRSFKWRLVTIPFGATNILSD